VRISILPLDSCWEPPSRRVELTFSLASFPHLRYYYAVATFSSVSAASYIHAECEGTEFERTANVFDLRFVPEEMDFDQEYR